MFRSRAPKPGTPQVVPAAPPPAPRRRDRSRRSSSTTGSSERTASSSGPRREEAIGEEHALLCADAVHRLLQIRLRRRRSGRSSRAVSGCRAVACRSPTRRGPWSRPGPRSTAAGGVAGRWPRQEPSPAPSCRRPPVPRQVAACRASSAGKPLSQGARRRCSPRRRAPHELRRQTRIELFTSAKQVVEVAVHAVVDNRTDKCRRCTPWRCRECRRHRARGW